MHDSLFYRVPISKTIKSEERMSKFGVRLCSHGELQALQEHELINLMKRYRAMLIREDHKNENARKIEVELCYLQRELELRGRPLFNHGSNRK